MSKMLGMDPAQANGFAVQMRAQADEVRGLVEQITVLLDEAGWFGNKATQLREGWNSLTREQLSRVIETLERSAVELDQHAANQIALSA